MSARRRLREHWRSRVPSTLLYTPGSEPGKIAKLPGFGCEAAILDLEDAVAVEQKPAARSTVRDGLAGLPESMLRLVRVNNLSTSWTADDLEGVVCPSLDGIVYPKAETADELWEVDELLGRAERANGLEPGGIVLIALIETALGLTRIDRILERAPDRLLTVGFGLGDFSVDMGLELGDYTHQLDYPRARISVAARASGLAPAIDGPWLELKDLEGLARDSRRSRGFGFAGRQLIYPPHVSVAASEYAGVDEQLIGYYQRVVTGFEAALAEKKGAVQIDGGLVDYPIYRRALQVLDAAGRMPKTNTHPASTKETS